jgi:hypothetical protein
LKNNKERIKGVMDFEIEWAELGEGADLEWRNVQVSSKTRGTRIYMIRGVSGLVKSGEMVAIIGPPGY